MAAVTSTIIAAAAIVSAGAAIYSIANQPKPPEIPPPPPPASYYSYDENGNPAGEQVWDPAKNAYVYKPAPISEEQKAERAKRDEIRNRMLENLNNAPEDRIRAYEEYARSFSDTMHRDVDKRYEDIVRAKEEEMGARGLFGSRAYADTVARLAKDKQDTDVDIASRASLAKEELSQADRNYYLNVLSNLDAGRRSDALIAMEKSQAASRGAQAGTAPLMAGYQTESLNSLRKWEAEMERNRDMTNTFADTATGLAFLYGYNKPVKTRSV